MEKVKQGTRIKKRKHPKRGVTLVDILVGVFVFGIILLAAMRGLKYSSLLSSSQDEYTAVNAILNEVADDIWTKTYDELTLGTSLSTNYTTGADKPTLLGSLPGGSIAVNVTEPEGTDTDLKKIEITVTWTTSSGPTNPQSLKIYRTDT